MTTPRPSITLNLIALSLACVFANGCGDTHKTLEQEPSIKSQADPFTEVETLTKLVDFSKQQQQSWFFDKHTSHQFIETANSKKLALSFSAKGNISELKIAPPSPWDLSSYNNYNVAFDVENTSASSVHVYLSIENPEGQLQSRSVSLPANYSGTVYFPLDGKEAQTNTGMWGDAPPWQTNDRLMVWRSWREDGGDFTKISAMNLFTIGVLEDKSILIGDIKLRKNPPSDPNWMVNVIDKYGQYTKQTNELTITSDEQLKRLAFDIIISF